jgi:hypothetical protein
LSVVLIPFTISRVISGCDTSSTAITPTWTISPVSTHPVLTATAFSLMERTIRPTETRLRPEKAHSCQDNVDSLVFDEGPADAEFASAMTFNNMYGGDWLQTFYEMQEDLEKSIGGGQPCSSGTSDTTPSLVLTDSQLLEMLTHDLAGSLSSESHSQLTEDTSSLYVANASPVDTSSATGADTATDDSYCTSSSSKGITLESSHPAAPCLPTEQVRTSNYREKRRKNNLASKRSRECKKERQKRIEQLITELEKENKALRQKVVHLENQIEIAIQQVTLH